MLANFGHLGWGIALAVVILSCLQTLNAYTVPRSSAEFVRLWWRLIGHNAVWWLLWLVCWTSAKIAVGEADGWIVTALLLALLAIVWQLWERNWLTVQQQTILVKDLAKTVPHLALNQPVRLVVVHDLRVGALRPVGWLRRLVQRINALDADGVLITGQWLDAAGADVFGKLMLLKTINKPCFGRLSTIDKMRDDKLTALEHGGDQPLAQMLPALGITWLDETASVTPTTAPLQQIAHALDLACANSTLQFIHIQP